MSDYFTARSGKLRVLCTALLLRAPIGKRSKEETSGKGVRLFTSSRGASAVTTIPSFSYRRWATQILSSQRVRCTSTREKGPTGYFKARECKLLGFYVRAPSGKRLQYVPSIFYRRWERKTFSSQRVCCTSTRERTDRLLCDESMQVIWMLPAPGGK